MNRIVQYFPALPVYEEGHEKGDLIWFLHGLGDTHYTWDEIFNDLKSDFRLLSMDLPGHGSSLEYFNEQSEYMDDAVSCLKKSTEQVSNDLSFFIAGHSLGAEIALQFAATFPDLVKGVVLLDGGYIQNEDIAADLATDLKQVQEFYKSYQFSSWVSYLENEKAYYQRWSDYVQKAAVVKMKEDEDKRIISKTTLATYEAAIRSLHIYPSKEFYSEVECPILLLRSSLPESSNAMKEVAAKRLIRAASHTTDQIIPNAGHNLHIDAPHEVANRIRKWIKVHKNYDRKNLKRGNVWE